MATTHHDTLARKFASLFDDPDAQEALAMLGARTRLPTFNLATSSLRHLPKWFDRLEKINNRQIGSHGNFVSDPASIGLVDSSLIPPVLTSAGQEFLSHKALLYNNPAQAEYQLLKTLYFGDHAHEEKAQSVLDSKRDHMLAVLRQFSAPRQEFLSQPSLLVIAELIASFPGAISQFLSLSEQELLQLAQMSEESFKALCSGVEFLDGLSRLCQRIGSDYTRAQERRLHHIISMAILTIVASIPPGGTETLRVPAPFSNLLTEQDIFNLHAKYTSDLVVWTDGVGYFVSAFLPIPESAPPLTRDNLKGAKLLPQRSTRKKTSLAATDASRNKVRAAQQEQSIQIINPLLSIAAEDLAEKEILSSMYGEHLVRAGHRSGEITPLPDGHVPGADFYVTDDEDTPIQFIEVKSIAGNLPVIISLTQAEYLRACMCVASGIPYGLLLVDVAKRQYVCVDGFDEELAQLKLGEVLQFSVKIG